MEVTSVSQRRKSSRHTKTSDLSEGATRVVALTCPQVSSPCDRSQEIWPSTASRVRSKNKTKNESSKRLGAVCDGNRSWGRFPGQCVLPTSKCCCCCRVCRWSRVRNETELHKSKYRLCAETNLYDAGAKNAEQDQRPGCTVCEMWKFLFSGKGEINRRALFLHPLFGFENVISRTHVIVTNFFFFLFLFLFF